MDLIDGMIQEEGLYVPALHPCEAGEGRKFFIKHYKIQNFIYVPKQREHNL
jgi:hypothetical protein